MSKLLFVVHRYAPYPGGSEYYVQNMAEECLRRGHSVTVFAGEHKGDLNGVKVSSDSRLIGEKWDAIIVHGADVRQQDIIHYNAEQINKVSPVIYMIIKPTNSYPAKLGIVHHRILSYSTTADIDFIKYHSGHFHEDYLTKSRRIRHGIPIEKTIKSKEGHPQKKIFISVGGFWKHKGFEPLQDTFLKANLPNTELHLYGYHDTGFSMLQDKRIEYHFNQDPDTVLKAIACADLYIMNSTEEGFGLVLLEAMANKTPWAARNIAGAKDMAQYGFTYETEEELAKFLYTSDPWFATAGHNRQIQRAYDYCLANHSITNTVDDIDDILDELKK